MLSPCWPCWGWVYGPAWPCWGCVVCWGCVSGSMSPKSTTSTPTPTWPACPPVPPPPCWPDWRVSHAAAARCANPAHRPASTSRPNHANTSPYASKSRGEYPNTCAGSSSRISKSCNANSPCPKSRCNPEHSIATSTLASRLIPSKATSDKLANASSTRPNARKQSAITAACSCDPVIRRCVRNSRNPTAHSPTRYAASPAVSRTIPTRPA